MACASCAPIYFVEAFFVLDCCLANALANSWPYSIRLWHMVPETFLSFAISYGGRFLLGPPCLLLVSMIDQDPRWQIGGPFLTTFHFVSLGLVPNLDRGHLTKNWFWNLFWVLERPFVWNLPGVLEPFTVLVPLVGSGAPWVLGPCLAPLTFHW